MDKKSISLIRRAIENLDIAKDYPMNKGEKDSIDKAISTLKIVLEKGE